MLLYVSELNTAKIFLLELKGRGGGAMWASFPVLVLSAVVGVTLTNSSTDWLTVLRNGFRNFSFISQEKKLQQLKRIQPKKMLEIL
jgi:hypothetical protein